MHLDNPCRKMTPLTRVFFVQRHTTCVVLIKTGRKYLMWGYTYLGSGSRRLLCLTLSNPKIRLFVGISTKRESLAIEVSKIWLTPGVWMSWRIMRDNRNQYSLILWLVTWPMKFSSRYTASTSCPVAHADVSIASVFIFVVDGVVLFWWEFIQNLEGYCSNKGRVDVSIIVLLARTLRIIP